MLNLYDFVRRSPTHELSYEFPTSLPYSIVSFRILSSKAEQLLEPVFAIARMQGLVRPVEVHIVLAELIAIAVEKLGTTWLVTNILGLEEVKHTEPVDWILSGCALINICA